MKINDLFKRDFNRPIETVIKADDQDNVYVEVDEYVITKEIANKVRDFFSAYNDYQGANGIWISGFFGSGKSHLLKILSYVLENKAFNGEKIGELFASKIEDDEMLKGDVMSATRIPSESILFNIDQQAQITSKTEENAILNVFYKVFNDHLGYFGGQSHVADFERWLDGEGLYSDFMKGYEEEAGEHWTKGRRKYFAPKTKEAISKVLGNIHNRAAQNYVDIIDTLRKDSRHSVEDFCEKVNAYIQTKEAGFRLNFYVDEVGQYISGNTKLMLNLQTIAETLATKCKGRSWLFVTSQEDIESVVGDSSAVQTDDFSKIQGRFKIRMPLTSANVDEVIEKRLLAKTTEASTLLGIHWKEQKANLNTLLSFSEAGVQFRKFSGEKDFVNKFPFAPYQFDLFQQCIKELSNHNAFQGKHASVGERSMLGVFQEVLRKLEHSGITTMVSFDLMFEGVRSTIRGELQNAITLAEKNITNPFAIKILKALFLVKYYTNFKTTERNISVLMLSDTSTDLKQHEREINEALNLLENQTYIQRTGDIFEYLTDDEKDVENEIKSTVIDDQQITQFFNEIIFDEIIGDNRIKYLGNKQDYEFTKKIDETIVGKEKEVTLQVITPNYRHYESADHFKAQTMGYNTLAMFVLPPTDRLLQDVRLYLKTEKYYKQNLSTQTKHSLQLIIIDKQRQNVERKRNLTTLLRRLLGEATVYLNGSKHPTGNSTDGKNKVVNVFQDLIKLAYPNLKMLGTIQYSDQLMATILHSRGDDLFGSDDSTFSEAESEVHNLIVRRKKQSERTSLTDLKDHFSKKPYGWYPSAIFCLTARLFKRGKIEARQDSNLLSDADFLSNLQNNRTHSNTIIDPQMDFDQRLVKKLKQVYQEMFDESCPGSEAREVAKAFKDKAKAEARELNQLIGNKHQYPFLEGLESIAFLLEQLSEREYGVLITSVKDFEDELLDKKETIADPIKKFWKGEQKKIFDHINLYINGDKSNFEFVENTELAFLEEVKNHPRPFEGHLIRDAKKSMETLKDKIKNAIQAEKVDTLGLIDDIKERITKREDFQGLASGDQKRVLQPFVDLADRAEQQRYIATLRQYRNDVYDMDTEQLNVIQKMLSTVEEPQFEYIKLDKVKVVFGKTELTSEGEVNEYVEKMREEFLRHIKQNRRIKL